MDWAAIIAAFVSPLISGLFGWLILRQGRKTHDTFNSKMDALLTLTDIAAFARGRKAESDSIAIHKGQST